MLIRTGRRLQHQHGDRSGGPRRALQGQQARRVAFYDTNLLAMHRKAGIPGKAPTGSATIGEK